MPTLMQPWSVKRSYLFAALALVWALVILALSVTPGQELPEVNFWEFDKFAHIGVYGLLSFLAAIAVIPQYEGSFWRLKASWVLWIVIAMYGLAIEGIQGAWIPQRYFDVFDLMANIIGSTLGLFAFIIIIAKRINPSL